MSARGRQQRRVGDGERRARGLGGAAVLQRVLAVAAAANTTRVTPRRPAPAPLAPASPALVKYLQISSSTVLDYLRVRASRAAAAAPNEANMLCSYAIRLQQPYIRPDQTVVSPKRADLVYVICVYQIVARRTSNKNVAKTDSSRLYAHTPWGPILTQ